MRVLWRPRLKEAVRFIADELEAQQDKNRTPLGGELTGKCTLANVELEGRADRIDRLADGEIAIVDYKTGKAPKKKVIDAGYALQLGLLGLIAEGEGFSDQSGSVGACEYWSLAKHGDSFGNISDATGGDAAQFLARTRAHFEEAAGRWLTGSEPFTARLVPEYSQASDYDQLMRLEEWYGRS